MSNNNDNESKSILETHKLFVNFLNLDIINNLINLFNEKVNLKKYIENERKKRGLHKNIKIKSRFYIPKNRIPTLILDIIKNNKSFIHLSIHLPLKHLNPENSGILHFYKNVYETKINKTKKQNENKLYTLINVIHPEDKPNSLEFSIDNNTKLNKTVNIYNKEIQKEMDVILTVLNRLFDEDNHEYYIGYNKEMTNIHNQTNNVARIINKYKKYATRKNKGKTYFPKIKKIPSFSIKYKRKTLKNRKNGIETRPALTYTENNINLSLLKPNNSENNTNIEYKRKTDQNSSKRRGKIETRPATTYAKNNVNLSFFEK
jgi:hypothetical protein